MPDILAWPCNPKQAADENELGRRIFRQGADGKQACAGCHGRDGLGSREGDSEAPPIRWDILSREMHYQGDDALNRALSQGITPSGAQLSGKMPRYFLSGDARSDLAAYLKYIAVDDQRGITADTVTIGVGVAESNDPLLSLLAKSTETLTRGHPILDGVLFIPPCRPRPFQACLKTKHILPSLAGQMPSMTERQTPLRAQEFLM